MNVLDSPGELNRFASAWIKEVSPGVAPADGVGAPES
jgi:hypothetical protein